MTNQLLQNWSAAGNQNESTYRRIEEKNKLFADKGLGEDKYKELTLSTSKQKIELIWLWFHDLSYQV